MPDMTSPTDDQQGAVHDYLRQVCYPLLDTDLQHELRLETLDQCPVAGQIMILVKLPKPMVGILVGKGGSVADALRSLAKVRMRTLGWRGHVDLRVVQH